MRLRHTVRALWVSVLGLCLLPARLLLAEDSCKPVAPTVTLRVATFQGIPSEGHAIEQLERIFECAHPEIDLELDLWDPYSFEWSTDPNKPDQVALRGYDLVEIDLCRFDEYKDNQTAEPRPTTVLNYLDPLPADMVQPASEYAGPAVAVLSSPEVAKYAAPHWICGNFLVTWASNTAVVNATSLPELLKALDATKAPLLGDFAGKTGLGEIYADAVLDLRGPDETLKHLASLRDKEKAQKLTLADLDEQARQALAEVTDRITTATRCDLGYFHTVPQEYPILFADRPAASLFGYSERFHFVEEKLALTPPAHRLGPDNTPYPIVGRDEIVVRPFPFGPTSQGTPAWIDAFVIPRGHLASKETAIRSFLQFIRTPTAYEALERPQPYDAPGYLLPAIAAMYKDPELLRVQPALPKYLEALAKSMPIQQARVWRGMRAAGVLLGPTLGCKK